MPLRAISNSQKKTSDIDETVGFVLAADDDRTVFRGTPKSWPGTSIWLHFLHLCLHNTPPG
jgi:hypothetical protein